MFQTQQLLFGASLPKIYYHRLGHINQATAGVILSALSHIDEQEFYLQLKNNSNIYKVTEVSEACENFTKIGFGPKLQFEDGSVKYDLSDNFLSCPLGHSFPAFQRISQSISADEIADNSLVNKANTLLEQLTEQSLLISSDSNNSLNSSIFQHGKFFSNDNLNFTQNNVALFGLHISKVQSDKPIAKLSLSKFIYFIDFIKNMSFLENNDLPPFKIRELLETKLSELNKINDFCYEFEILENSDIKSLNKAGIFINSRRLYFPLSLNESELNDIFQKLGHLI